MEYNLGILNESFLRGIVNFSTNKNTQTIIKEYVKLFKGNKNLMVEFNVYQNIMNGDMVNDKKMLINENISYIKDNVDFKNLSEKHIEIKNLFEKHGIDIIEDCENKELFENIHSLIFMKNSIKTVNEKTKLIENIENLLTVEIINEENEKTHQTIDNFDAFYKIMVENFNKKYNNLLSEEDKKLFKIITSKNLKEDKEKFHNELLKECLSLTNKLLSEDIDIEVKEKALMVKERLLEQQFSEEDYVSNIINLNNLKNTLLV